ncbi:reverse transcriptase family protein [Paenibacillus andongensis]|uniref:reverse transcriptase family protein n=1 Tax=Paenibacillus andongensis TaxID=2975482 RepID=UPI0021BAC675|nr:reverse transcriptase family protein [Paenibacillus andongensis]
MNWEMYKDKFYYLAKFSGKDELYIQTCLSYAEKLFRQGLPVIYDLEHLSMLVGYKESYILKVCNSQSYFYRTFKIPKKVKGEYREISEPLPNLKNIQHWILNGILYNLSPNPHAKAYRRGYFIKDNAKYHRNQKTVLTIDIKDYFVSIGFKKVLNLFMKIGYCKSVAVALTNLCILNNGLPQGAPTSAMLSNLTTITLDEKISYYTSRRKIRYTRYADDMTFSGDLNEDKVIKFINEVLRSEEFVVNEQKTRTRHRNQQQEVTGIVVNEKLQVSRGYRKSLRQVMYYIKKYGLESHLRHTFEFETNKRHYVYQLLGKANFILSINPNDVEVKEYYNYLKELLEILKDNYDGDKILS